MTSSPPAKPGVTQKLKRSTRSGLDSALQVLKTSTLKITPLVPVVSDLLECLDIIKASTKSTEEYEELTSELATMASALDGYMSELESDDLNGSAVRILESIRVELANINQQQGRGKGRRLIESKQDQDNVIKSYRRVEVLFRQLQTDISLRTWYNTRKQHITLLLQSMSPVDDARYDSSYSTTIKRHGCTEFTREQVQAGLRNWIQDPNGTKIYWMNGMAGTGKTTIAYSLCEWLEDNRRLGGSFFCSRGSSSCQNVNSIIPTIAYQLAWYSPAFRSELCRVLEKDPGGSKRNVVKQFEKLIQDPLVAAKDSMPEGVVVVIDALDECDDSYGVQLILGTLLKLGRNLLVKIFVTSRPEPTIRDNMLSSSTYSPSILHLHDIEESVVEEDVKKYLVEAFDSMSPPPSDEQIKALAKQSGNLFIYAVTVVRYVMSRKGPANPAARLDAILTPNASRGDKRRSNKKYKQLDDLYDTVLAAAFDIEDVEEEEIEVMRLVLWTVVCAQEPMTITTLGAFLSLTEQEALSALQPLLSVLHISGSDRSVSILHASFPDYMLDCSRSGDFSCDEAAHSGFMADRCFNVMKEQLRFNICNLESSFVFDQDIPDLEQRIRTNISSELFYACRYWGKHLHMAAMAMRRRRGVDADRGGKMVNSPKCVRELVVDASDFVTRFAAGACVQSTPHIYISALPLCATSSSVYRNYWRRTQGLMELKGTVTSRRNETAQATLWVFESVASVALSGDGTRIVSGSSDFNIRVWDARTGEVVAGPFQGHTRWVNAVAFSPDGARLASGSDDCTIRVWDARLGDVIAKPFQGHTGPVNSVAFSPDGTRILSGSGDCTIRLWDPDTGSVTVDPIRGHIEGINSVVFSPNGLFFASGSRDCTIRVWDIRTSDVIFGPLQGHSKPVNSVAFSPDSHLIVSGSCDCNIRVWNARTGSPIAGPFQGHTNPINTVTFSSDGTRIVSGSDDGTIRFWDAESGDTVVGPLQAHIVRVSSIALSFDDARVVSGSADGTIRVWSVPTKPLVDELLQVHAGPINSVALSSDNTYIFSGSSDATIRVWDARTGDAVSGPLQEDNIAVRSIALSPDGTRIASGSRDRTIRVWDAHTGIVILGPLEGHTLDIKSVVFSPDGMRIASGSSDSTIRVWDAHTGGIAAGPFQGHSRSVNSVAFSPDGANIASGSDDETIRVWDADSGEVVIGPLQGHTSWVGAVAFSPDGTQVVSGSGDCTVRLWDTHNRNVVTEPFRGHTAGINSVAFSPDGTLVATGSSDHTVRVWNTRSGTILVGPLRGHTDLVNSVVFSSDGVSVVSGSNDRTIRVWSINANNAVFGLFQTCKILVPASKHSVETISENCSTSTSIADAPGQISEQVVYNDDNWVISRGLPLFWFPPDLWHYVPYPGTNLVIGSQGALWVDRGSVVLGESWSQCYISE